MNVLYGSTCFGVLLPFWRKILIWAHCDTCFDIVPWEWKWPIDLDPLYSNVMSQHGHLADDFEWRAVSSYSSSSLRRWVKILSGNLYSYLLDTSQRVWKIFNRVTHLCVRHLCLWTNCDNSFWPWSCGIGYVIYVMSQHDKCYSIPLYTFGSVLGPKHGLGKNTIKNVIPENNLGFCFWMDGLWHISVKSF
jgi:hypothetical protein